MIDYSTLLQSIPMSQQQQDPFDTNTSQQQQQLHPAAQPSSSTMLNSNNNAAPAPGGNASNANASSMSAAMFGLAPNAIAGLLPSPSNSNAPADQSQQQSQQQQPTQQQQALDLTQEIKRLQQIHQMSTAGQSNPNALLMTGQQTHAQQANQQAALMQSLFAGAAAGGGDASGNNANSNNQAGALFAGATGSAPFNPVMQPGLLQDARLLSMAQSHFGAPLMQAASAPTASAAGLGVGGEAQVPLPSPHSLFHRDGTRRMRGGVIEPFPEKLHRLLTECELANRSDVISWVANGRAFSIHKPDKFFKEIVPLYFRQSRLSSFKRQLNLYGFELINSGPSRGGYFHELFVKDHPESCRRMRRVAVKVSSSMKANAKTNNNQQGGDQDTKVAAAASATAPTDVKVEASSQALADNVRAFVPGADGGVNMADLLAAQQQQQHQEHQGGNNNLGGL